MKKILLSLAFLLLFTNLSAEEADTETPAETPAPAPAVTTRLPRSRVNVIIDMEAIFVRQEFLLTFIVEFGEPEEVHIIPPILHDALTIEKIVITPREIEQRPGTRPRPRGAEPEYQTIVEITMISTQIGQMTLEPFLIETPDGIITTNSMILHVRPSERAQVQPTLRFIWEGAPRQAAVGDRVTITLRYRTLPAEGDGIQTPPPSFFMPTVPRGVLLSNAQISAQERQNGVVLKVTLIPLEAGTFSLPARVLTQGNIRFEIPALNVQLTPDSQKIDSTGELEDTSDTEETSQSQQTFVTPVFTPEEAKSEKSFTLSLPIIIIIIILALLLLGLLFFLITRRLSKQ